MTLYCWIHWFWITFNLSTRWVLLSASPIGIAENMTTIHVNTKLEHNGTEFLFSATTVSAVSSFKSFISNQTDKPNKNKTESLLTGEHNITTAALPKNQTNVIDTSSNTLVENINSSNMSNVNSSCNSCNDDANNSSVVIANLNIRQSLTANSSRTDQHDVTSNSSLSAAGITGISLGCLGFMLVITVIAFIAYRNIGFNRPQVLNDHCSNPDSSGYIDDSTMRENSEEMYSLDNDSFLNSLEAMTIQNLWTDTVKHTKL